MISFRIRHAQVKTLYVVLNRDQSCSGGRENYTPRILYFLHTWDYLGVSGGTSSSIQGWILQVSFKFSGFRCVWETLRETSSECHWRIISESRTHIYLILKWHSKNKSQIFRKSMKMWQRKLQHEHKPWRSERKFNRLTRKTTMELKAQEC